MKRILIVTTLLMAFVFTGASYAQEEYVIIGKVLELGERSVQVKNCTYEVEMVLVDVGMGKEPVLGSMTDLKEGSPVKVYVTSREGSFGTAQKVIVFTGKSEADLQKFLSE